MSTTSDGRLYVVQWTDDGHGWWLVTDEQENRQQPAVYPNAGDAAVRRDEMAEQFPEASYRVVAFKQDESFGPWL
jgi:hypothetical protein